MKAYELLDSPEKWTQKTAARNDVGRPVSPTGDGACRFCVAGAIERCVGPQLYDAYMMRFGEAIGLNDNVSILKWNDAPDRTFEQVREALIKADV